MFRGGSCFPTRPPPVVGRSILGGPPMIALTNESQTLKGWQHGFLAWLPELQSRLRREFRDLKYSAREEAVSEAVVHCLLSYARLHERGRADIATPRTLALYA